MLRGTSVQMYTYDWTNERTMMTYGDADGDMEILILYANVDDMHVERRPSV